MVRCEAAESIGKFGRRGISAERALLEALEREEITEDGWYGPREAIEDALKEIRR